MNIKLGKFILDVDDYGFTLWTTNRRGDSEQWILDGSDFVNDKTFRVRKTPLTNKMEVIMDDDEYSTSFSVETPKKRGKK